MPVRNLVFQRSTSEQPLNVIFKCISDDIPPQLKTLNFVIPILRHSRSLSEIGASSSEM